MNRRSMLGISVVTVLGLALPGNAASGASKVSKKQLVGPDIWAE
jgi:hypothetical protein